MRNVMAKNSLVLLLLSVFLITNVGNAIGYAWCFGDDGHSRIEQASFYGCADKEAGCSASLRYGSDSLSKAEPAHCSPCSDLLIEGDNAVVSKRIIKDAKVVLEAEPLSVSPLVSYEQQANLKYISHPPRVAQTIRAHRTVVLLN